MNEAQPSLEALYRDLGPRLLRYLRRFVDATAAEDLLHETFCHAARRPAALNEAVSAAAWLFGIARHVGLTALRRRRSTVCLPPDLVARVMATDADLERVHAALARLPAGQREALELRLHHELSYEEIAGVLAIPVGTVRSRLHNALRAVRADLTDSA